MKKYIFPALVSAVISLLIHFSVLNNYFLNLSYDTLTNLRSSSGKASGVVIVGIDDASLSKYDKTNTGVIPREIYAELLNKLKKWKPEAAAFDIIFDIKTENDQHDSFIEAIKNFEKRVVLSSYFQRTPDQSGENYVTPYEKSGLQNVFWGYVNVFRGISEDDDMIRRRFRPFERIENRIVYSLPLALAECAYSVEITGTFDRVDMIDRKDKSVKMSLPLSAGHSYINYSGSIEGFHVLTLDDILSASGVQAEIFEKLVREKIVLVGSVSPRHRDIQDIPTLTFDIFKRKRQEYGVVILANIIQSIIDAGSIGGIQSVVELPALVIVNSLCGIAYAATGPLTGAAIFLACAAISLFIGFSLFSKGVLFNSFVFLACLVVTYFVMTFRNYYLARTENIRVSNILKKYVSPEIAKMITREEYERSSQGSKRIITVMFSDIRGFTPLSEKMDPEDISTLLNQYFNKMTEVIFRNKGTIDKFIGDAIMVIFGAPLEQDDAPLRAVRTAVEMRDALQKLRDKWKKEGIEDINIGIGINTGEAFVGNIGSDIYKEYTALGDTVNTAARFESRAAKGQIFISESTLRAVRKQIIYRVLEPIMLKGKSKPQEVFEVLELAADGEGGAVDIETNARPKDGRETATGKTIPEEAGDETGQILLKAVSEGLTDEVRALLENGANVNFADPAGLSPIIVAANTGNIEIMNLLLKKKPELNTRSGKGLTALIIAAGRGHCEIVELLLREGADASIKLENGMTAMKFAQTRGHEATVEKFKKSGISL